MFNKTVDSIVKPFFKMANNLENLVDNRNEQIDTNNEHISFLNNWNEELTSDKVRAQKISKKIQELLSI